MSTAHPSKRSWPLVPLLTLLLLGLTVLWLPPPPPPPVTVADVQPPHQWAPGRLRIGVDAAYVPFAVLENGQYRGHDIELARQLADHLGLTPEFVNIPFDGLFDALRVSRIDVIISALPYAEEYEGQVIYSRPYFEAGEVIITAHARPLRDQRALRGQRLGAELGSLGDQTARRLAARAGFSLRSDFDSAAAGLAALEAGAIDGFVTDRVSALALVRTLPSLTISDWPLASTPYVIGVPFDAPEFARQVDSWLEERQRDGSLARLAERHGLSPSPTARPGGG